MRGAAKAGIIGAAMDIVAVAIIGALTAGHDAIHGYISTLGTFGAPLRGWYVAAGTISSALHLWFIIGVRRAFGKDTSVYIAATLLGLFFVLQWLAAAFFPCDPGCEWITIPGQLHYALSFSAFVMFCIGIIVTTWVADTHHLRFQHRWINSAAVACIASALALLATDRLDIYNGLVERITIVMFSTWTVILAVSLPKRSSHS